MMLNGEGKGRLYLTFSSSLLSFPFAPSSFQLSRKCSTSGTREQALRTPFEKMDTLQPEYPTKDTFTRHTSLRLVVRDLGVLTEWLWSSLQHLPFPTRIETDPRCRRTGPTTSRPLNTTLSTTSSQEASRRSLGTQLAAMN